MAKDHIDDLSEALTGGAAGQPRQVAKQMFQIIQEELSECLSHKEAKAAHESDMIMNIITRAGQIKGGDCSFRQVMKILDRMLEHEL